MQAGSTGCLRQRLVTSSPRSANVSGIGAIAKRQFGADRLLHKLVQSHGVKPAKQSCSRLIVSATKDLPLPVILDRDFDKEGSRIYKRTVRLPRVKAHTFNSSSAASAYWLAGFHFRQLGRPQKHKALWQAHIHHSRGKFF